MSDPDVQGMLIQIEATTAQMRRELALGEQAVAKAATSIDRNLAGADSAFDRLSSKAESAASLIRGAMAGIAGAGLIGGLIQQADAYGQMADRMRAATSSSAEYEMVQKHILTTAQETYRPLREAQELYIRTADVMKGLGYNTQQTLDITDSFSYLLVTNAASADKANGALDAYSKSLQTGKIDADGWVSIMTAMPTVAEAVAAATGKTSKEIRKLGAEGKLDLGDLNKGLEQVRETAQKAAAAMSVSVMDALNNVNNAIGDYIGRANESTSATGELAKVLDLIAKNIDSVAAAGAGLVATGVTAFMLKNAVAAWNSATALIAEAKATRDAAAAQVEKTAASAALAAAYATEMSATVASSRATEASAVAKVRVLQAARDQLAYTAALAKGTQEEARYAGLLAATELELAAAKKSSFAASAQLGVALTAESAAMAKDATATTAASAAKKEYAAVSSLAARAGSGLLGLLGGPAGIVALAVGAGVALWTMSEKTDAAALSLDDMKQPLDEVIARFKTLNEDQRKAALVRWGEEQAAAAKTVASEFGNLAASIRSATVDPSQARLSGYSVQLKEYSALIARLKEAQANGQSLTPILEELRGKGGIDDAQINSWIKQAGVVSIAGDALKDVTLKLDAQTSALNVNTAETNANNAAKRGMSEAGTTYLEALQKQLAGLQDGGDATKIANRYISEHADLTDADKTAIVSAASAIEANKEATKQAAAATKSGNSAAKEAAAAAEKQAKALADLKTQAVIAIDSANGLAAAYLAGTDKSREFTLQQKVEEALLKTGAGARKDVEKAINDQQDAQDKLNVSKSAYDLQTETTQLVDQARATLRGADALAAYNAQKALTVALTGKKIDVGSEEYKQLVAATQAQQEAVKLAKQASDVGSIMDRLYPEAKLLQEYVDGQNAINAAMGLAPEKTGEYQAALVRLGNEYEVNRSKATLWGQMTEGAIDRIDEAFASAWGNIGSGAESLWDNLVKGFKQTLGEIAHMLTTKPLLASISNWLTGTDNGQGLSSVWGKLLGSAGGSSSGSGGLFSGMAGIGKNLYSAWNTITGVGSSVASGYASGGIGGAISGGAGYYSNMLSNIASTLSSGFTSLVGGNIAITGATAAGTAATTAALTGLTAAQAAAAAATVGAEGITAATLSAAVAEGAASIGTNIGVAGATTAAASQGIGAAISSAMSSAAAMWPLAVVMGMYQSGKLYSAGVRPDAGEMWDSAGSTALGKAAMLPQTVGAKYFEVTDNVLGKVVGGKMAAILSGSTLFQAVWSKVGSKLFGSGYETKDAGISLGVEGGVLDAQQYIKQKKKGGLLSGSSKTRFIYNPLDAGTSDALGGEFNEVVLGAGSLFTALGIKLNESVLDGLNVASRNISNQGSPEWIQQQVDFFFAQLGDAAVIAISKATDAGLSGFSYVGLQAFVKNLQDVNGIIGHLNIGLYDMSVSGGFMAEQLSAWAGGIEALRTSAAGYYDKFYTDAEKASNTLSDVRKEFENIGVALPNSRQGYRDMVEGIDKTTEAGRAMLLTLMSLSGDASTAYDILESNATTANQALANTLNNAVTGAMGAVQRAVSAEKGEVTKAYNDRTTYLNDIVSKATENVSGLSAAGNDLSAALKALRGDSDDAVKMLRAQAQATLQSALTIARSGGSLAGLAGLSDALDTVSNNNTDLYASMEDFARDQGRTANVVAELNALNGKQLSTEEQLLASAQDQIKLAKDQFDEEMAKFDQQLELAQAQIDALNGVDNSVLSVAAAMSGLSAAITAALAAKPAASAAANTSANNSTLLNAVYQSVLGRDVDTAGAAYWGDLLKDGKQDYAGLVDAITKDAKANGELKKYATGGLITGPGTGTSDSIFARLSAGEYVLRADAVRTYGTGLLDQMNNLQLPAFAKGGGPQLEVVAPSTICSAHQAGTMRSSEMNTVQLEQKVDVLIDVVKQIVGPMKINSDADSKLFKKWDRVGLQTIAVGA